MKRIVVVSSGLAGGWPVRGSTHSRTHGVAFDMAARFFSRRPGWSRRPTLKILAPRLERRAVN
jgi:hypothetical protein